MRLAMLKGEFRSEMGEFRGDGFRSMFGRLDDMIEHFRLIGFDGNFPVFVFKKLAGKFGRVQHCGVHAFAAKRRHDMRGIAEKRDAEAVLPVMADRQCMDRPRHDVVVAGFDQAEDVWRPAFEFGGKPCASLCRRGEIECSFGHSVGTRKIA